MILMMKFATSVLLALSRNVGIVDNIHETPIVVVFGRPGAGKTTVANAALKAIEDLDVNMYCLGLDLDVCVPQWMKDNFAKGIYPTLQEREVFARSCCDYVDSALLQEQMKKITTVDASNTLCAIISFSFVNTDLRDSFRSRFPSAEWVLIETDQEEANKRINERQGHFFKANLEVCEAEEKGAVQKRATETLDKENSDWHFAPVNYPHLVVSGKDTVEKNAEKVVQVLQKAWGLRRQ